MNKRIIRSLSIAVLISAASFANITKATVYGVLASWTGASPLSTSLFIEVPHISAPTALALLPLGLLVLRRQRSGG